MSAVEAVGGLLFRHRGWIPVPLAALALVPVPEPRPVGWLLLAAGEGLRLWAVGHIGRRSRTRGEGVGELVDRGPYARLRNPLYVGNLLIWAALGAFGWPAGAVVVPCLLVHYALIVRWEERVLAQQIGAAYLDYQRRVPRWWPSGPPRAGSWEAREAFRSERGTFVVIAVAGAAFVARWYLSR